MYNYNANGWFPEQEYPQSLADFFAQADYQGVYPWDETDRPPVIRWSDFEPVLQQRAQERDKQRAAGLCFWPWVIARYFGINWIDPNQGSLGTCAGFAADSASFCMLLQHLADGVELEFVPTNPYPAWVLGREDANYIGGGASLSMVLNGINKYGRFPVSKVGTYNESIKKRVNWRNYLQDAEPFQVGCCYLGNLSSRELADSIILSVRAGHPIVFGGSTAVANKPVYREKIKTGSLQGRWAHATAFVAYRLISGTVHLAHMNSWGNVYGIGEYEKDPGSIIWLSENDIRTMCAGTYRDAFSVTYVESVTSPCVWNLAPRQIPFPAIS